MCPHPRPARSDDVHPTEQAHSARLRDEWRYNIGAALARPPPPAGVAPLARRPSCSGSDGGWRNTGARAALMRFRGACRRLFHRNDFQLFSGMLVGSYAVAAPKTRDSLA